MSSLVDKAFYTSIAIKGFDGLVELIAGILLLLIAPTTLSDWALALHYRHPIASATTTFGALYLISHGVVKIVLVLALVKQKLWAYPWMIGFLVVFIAYQVYRMVISFSWALLVLTIFDIFVIWLTAIEYKKHKAKLAIESTEQ